MEFKGKAWAFGDDINTDLIIPARYLNSTDPKELAAHCMEDEDPQFPSKVRSGDMIVGGKNFGCGSSREHAPIAIKAVGVSVIIAHSFARIFYRNAFNLGIPILESKAAAAAIQNNDVLDVDIGRGRIYNTTRDETYHARPTPAFMQELLAAGGLVPYVKKKNSTEGGNLK
jgi:3-isopropylmalate dehydratase small subunit